jgi:hypothetical protein
MPPVSGDSPSAEEKQAEEELIFVFLPVTCWFDMVPGCMIALDA